MTEISTPGMDRETAALEAWGRTSPNRKLELPSGAVVTIRTLEIPDLIGLDILDKMDAFTPRVMAKKGKKAKEEDQPELKAEKLLELMLVLDKVAAAAVVSPKLSILEEGETPDENARYASAVSVPDKMEIFQQSFSGMEEFFRLGGQQEAGVGAVEAVEAPAHFTK